jgi:hypothetical protein
MEIEVNKLRLQNNKKLENLTLLSEQKYIKLKQDVK